MDQPVAHENLDQDFFKLIMQPNELRLMSRLAEARPSRAERIADGEAIRQRVPRSSHAAYRPPKGRASPVVTLAAQNATLIQSLVPVRMSRMAASPFAFLRGTAAIMAADLAPTPVTGLQVMACGDMHLANFGLFGSAERNLVFAINDFDEAHPGYWEWDLKRLAASAAVAAYFVGGDRVDAQAAAHASVEAYVKWIRRYARMGFLEVWYDLIDEKEILAATRSSARRSVAISLAKARARGRVETFERTTEKIAGEHRIVEDIPLIVRESHLADGTPINEAVARMLRSYARSLPADRMRLLSRYHVVDVARKVVGVGSVGTSCWVVLMEGLGASDPLVLQVKEARPSVLAPYAPSAMPVHNQGQRIVMGQRMIQGSPDIFLGWGSGDDEQDADFYIRQLADMKGGERFAAGDRECLGRLVGYSRLCGWALALAHAKSGDPAVISGYCGRSDALPDAISRFAMAYREQTERDHDALVTAIHKGRLPAEAEHGGSGE